MVGEATIGVFDLSAPRTLHVIGVGGAGMSAIALVLATMGHRVSGSDLKETAGLERLRVAGVDVRVGHDPAHVPADADAVVISTAVPRANPEMRAADAAGIRVLRRAEALAAIVTTRRAIAVAGSHGKTTTSSMLALVLRAAGLHPSFIIGGELNEVGTNAAYDDGDWMVVEADESDGTFLELDPEAAIVTSVEPDHLDHYGGFSELVDAFGRFLDRVPGPRVVCADDRVTGALAGRTPSVRTYGWSADADYRVVDYTPGRVGSSFALEHDGRALGVITLPVPGRHNALNAAGAAAMATELDLGFGSIVAAMGSFGGVARRFQFRGEVGGVTLVDDYAHLPGEVAHMIAAVREGGWRRIVVVFQPHRYTRTASLWRDFADAFVGADQLVLTDVYPAGEPPAPGVSGRLVLRAVLDAHPELAVAYFPRRADLVELVRTYAHPGDLVLTLGAGDLTTLPDEWHARAGGRVNVALTDVGVELAALLPGRVTVEASVAELTTYRVGGPIRALVRAGNEAELAHVAAVVRARRPPLLVVGMGSNLLVADEGYDGLALLLDGEFGGIELDRDRVRAGGAVALPVLARRAAAAGCAGLEFLVGIPGTIGGAVRMNAGGHGRETREVLRRAWIADLSGTGTPEPRSAEELRLGYRRSELGEYEVVTAAELVARPDDPVVCDRRIVEIVRWRRAHQPGGANAGSVFRNPPGDSAGRLVDACGLKGRRVGGAVVSTKHANFIQADPGARAADVRRLVLEVRQAVEDATGVRLEPELRMIGFAEEEL